MTAQKKFITILITVIVGVFLWLYFFYLPTLSVINKNKTTLLTYNTKIKSASDASSSLDEVKLSLEKLKNELIVLEQKIVDKSQLENFAKLLETEAQKYKLTVINVSPIVNYYFRISEENPTGTYISRLPFEMNCTSDFMSFSRFLDNLENLPFYIHPEGIHIEVSPTSPGQLDIRLLSSVYVKTGV